MALWTPPLFKEDPKTGRMTQRAGASLSLSAFARKDALPEGVLRIGRDARIEVDPGQAIRLQSRGQMQIQGTLRAPGGQIVVARGADPVADAQQGGLPNSVWIEWRGLARCGGHCRHGGRCARPALWPAARWRPHRHRW